MTTLPKPMKSTIDDRLPELRALYEKEYPSRKIGQFGAAQSDWENNPDKSRGVLVGVAFETGGKCYWQVVGFTEEAGGQGYTGLELNKSDASTWAESDYYEKNAEVIAEDFGGRKEIVVALDCAAMSSGGGGGGGGGGGVASAPAVSGPAGTYQGNCRVSARLKKGGGKADAKACTITLAGDNTKVRISFQGEAATVPSCEVEADVKGSEFTVAPGAMCGDAKITSGSGKVAGPQFVMTMRVESKAGETDYTVQANKN